MRLTLGMFMGRLRLKVRKMLETMKAPHCVVRVGWLYDFEGANFFNTMQRLGSEEVANLRIGEDQIPTWAEPQKY